MRVGILAHSFSAAWKIHRELSTIPEVDVFIILSVPANRSVFRWWIANLTRLAVLGFRELPSFTVFSIFSRRVVLLLRDFNHPSSVATVQGLNLDVGLHKSGVIYREEIINAFRLGILNPHIGILPAYRGRNVMEWAILQGDPVGVTVFFIDTGIDTGSHIVLSHEVDISHCRSVTTAKRYLFDLDVILFTKALAILKREEPSFQINDGSGQRYYVMSKLFQGVVEELLQRTN